MLKSYFNETKNILLLNTQYVVLKNEESGAITGFLYLIYRDTKTKEKKIVIVENPKTTTFITKPEYRSSFKTQRLFLPFNQVDAYDVQYRNLAYFIMNKISEDGKDTEYLKVCKDVPKEAFKWRHSYFADYNICDYAMISYITNNEIPNTNISYAFLDIEGDIYGLSSTEIDEGSYPINAVSVVLPFNELGEKFKRPKVFTLLLRNHNRYKQQKYFEEHLDEFLKECHSEFDDKYDKPQINISIFDDEIKMLRALFALLHKLSPDFIMIWNMSYDIPTIIKRLCYLGQDPTEYFSHPDFPVQRIQYNYDMIYKNDIKNKSDSFDCTSYSMWIDQMLIYAGIRKSKSDYGGNSLDNVAKIELNAEKRRYDGKNVSVINGAIEEYCNFVKYSINDVLLQYGIDKKTNDLQSLFEQSLYGGTRLSKTLKQSVYLKNVFAIEYFNQGVVPRNNNNVNYSRYKDDERAVDFDAAALNAEADYDDIELAGALVGDPMNNAHTGAKILGERSNSYYSTVIDMDYSSMYPNIKIVFNIAENTQIGRVIINDKILEDENPDNNPKFIRAGKFIEDYETGDSSNVSKWIGLPQTYDIIKQWEKERLHLDD